MYPVRSEKRQRRWEPQANLFGESAPDGHPTSCTTEELYTGMR